eukprot:m.184881 g.184881  ORF g.184881 m.184881 type:complete len:64 (+) comp39333_c0_seq63:506-697(+)
MSFHLHEHVHFEEASKVHGTLCALLKKWIMEILRILDKKQKEASLSAQKIHESSLTAGQKTIS